MQAELLRLPRTSPAAQPGTPRRPRGSGLRAREDAPGRALWTRGLWTRALWTGGLWTRALWTWGLWTRALWTRGFVDTGFVEQGLGFSVVFMDTKLSRNTGWGLGERSVLEPNRRCWAAALGGREPAEHPPHPPAPAPPPWGGSSLLGSRCLRASVKLCRFLHVLLLGLLFVSNTGRSWPEEQPGLPSAVSGFCRRCREAIKVPGFIHFSC